MALFSETIIEVTFNFCTTWNLRSKKTFKAKTGDTDTSETKQVLNRKLHLSQKTENPAYPK